MASEIPPDIITDILHRLPTKSLCRFKSVSKNWLSQISNPQFINRHQTTFNRHHLICNSNTTSLCSIPINPHDHQKLQNPKNLTSQLPHADVFIFHGSCNGLVLCSTDDFVNSHSLIIFNPTTNEFVELPESGFEIVNNLLEIDIMYGFGYDSVTDDYKVVTVSYFHYNYLIPPDTMYVHVFSLRNNTWRRVSDSGYDHSHGRSVPGVLVDGFVHWIANKGSDGLRVIVGFSLADERFSEVPLPGLGDRVDVMMNQMNHDCELVVVGDKLGVFLQDEVWLMNEYGLRESWLRILIDGVNELTVVDTKVVCVDGKIMLVSDGVVWVYDVGEKCLCESIDVSRDVKGLKVKGSYVESLVSPKLS